jgi:hypothetical protein
MSTPHPADGQPTLNGVACASPTFCLATGWAVGATVFEVPVAEKWDGSRWSIQSTALPAGAQAANFDGVACSSKTFCIAVGVYANRAGKFVTLAEKWNGSHWTVQPTPNPANFKGAGLNAVACTSPSACTSVGGFATHAGNTFPLTEVWNGSHWSIQPTPTPSNSKQSQLLGVACPSASLCIAVGQSGGGGLAEVRRGSRWTIQHVAIPAGAQSVGLNSVACFSATACTGVGNYAHLVDATAITATLAEIWNGTRWTVQPTPVPSGAQLSSLAAAACASASICMAVGSSGTYSGTSSALAESRDG